MRIRSLALVALFALPMAAQAQLLSVPQRGVADEWVKQLKIPLGQDWEWIETYQDRVFFVTAVDAKRKGDTVTMWTRVEFKEPQGTAQSPYRSIASFDDWDCKAKRRGTTLVIMYRYSNLEDRTPLRATNAMKQWEPVPPRTVGEAMLEFACGLKLVAEPITPHVRADQNR